MPNTNKNNMSHQRKNTQKILIFTHLIPNHNWRNIYIHIYIYIYIYIIDKTSIKRNILTNIQNTNGYINITTLTVIYNTNSKQQ